MGALLYVNTADGHQYKDDPCAVCLLVVQGTCTVKSRRIPRGRCAVLWLWRGDGRWHGIRAGLSPCNRPANEIREAHNL